MEDKPTQATHAEPVRIRKANDYTDELKHVKPPEMLFDEFWRTGELAMLFGSAGSGKSILGVQIAEALASGRAIDGFRMPKHGRRVLYVDMEMSDSQFVHRNSVCARGSHRVRTHKFSGNFYREPPLDVDALSSWLQCVVKAKGIRVVVIDSLSAVKKTQDGMRETLRLMRELRVLRDELGISILVLADALETRRGKTLTEADFGRSRVLCSVADSVFAICRHRTHFDHRFIVQTGVRNAPVAWTSENAPLCSIVKQDSGMLAFRFDDLFVANLGAEELELICNLKVALDEGGETFRSAAELFEISLSRAQRLYKKWSPAIEARYRKLLAESEPPAVAGGQSGGTAGRRRIDAGVATVPNEAMNEASVYIPSNWPPAHAGGSDPIDHFDEFDEAGIERPPWLEIEEANASPSEDNPLTTNEHRSTQTDTNSWYRQIKDPTQIPFTAALRRRTIYDLKHALDAYGRDIYIETVREYDGSPKVWYQFDNLGFLHKKVRDMWGIIGTRLGQGPYLSP